MPAAPHEQALFGEPGLPAPRAGLGALARGGAVRRRSGGRAGRRRCCSRSDGDERSLRVEAVREVAEQDWVRLTQSQFDAGRDHRPSSGSCRAGTKCPAAARARDPPRSGPGLRHRHAPHHAHVPALDRAPRDARRPSWRRVLDYGCGSGVLAIAAALHGARDIDAVDIDAAAVDSDARQRRCQRRRDRAGAARSARRALCRWCSPTSWPRR